jgi:hypothetical protein
MEQRYQAVLAVQVDGLTVTEVAAKLGRDGVEDVPSAMAIWRALGRHGLIVDKPRRKRLPTYKRRERGRPMELWQLEVVGGVLLVDGTEGKILTGVDDHSRFCVAAGIVRRAMARSVCGVFAQSLRTYGGAHRQRQGL